jgi:hypothetical protein
MEMHMPTLKASRGLVVLAFVASLATVQPSVAASKRASGKKLTYDQAWAFCKDQLDKRFSWSDHSQRYAAGGSCMLRFGYRI